ncbi:LPD5 domain-containing protein [Marinobacter nauticus]|uniref:LPD38 domain-containing protein n=1 Tax=Marinobacter nauticus TaxID=2743 RepID=UPI001D1880A5|nr:LPD38 domain-containing protein [Marinobacter nauticus]MCC4269220.1 LPD5 domain-containing protein [Marinobacter nauticus]
MRAEAFLEESTDNESVQKLGSAEVFLTASDPEPTTNSPEPAPSMNMGRGAVERGGQLLGGLFTAGNAMAEQAEQEYPLGGLVWEDGLIPDYKNPEEYQRWRAEQGGDEPLKAAADYWANFDAGYVPEHTWESVKQEFGEGGALSGSAWGEVLAYGAEQGVKSIPDMFAAMANLPGYVMARSGEIGEERARNKGKEGAELVDVAEAAPFALGSAILERMGASGITQAGAETLGKEALKAGIGKMAKEGAKAGAKEAGTEFLQEGIIEYLGEKLGTDAAMSVWEALDRGAAGAVAGGVYGTTAGTAGAAVNEVRNRRQSEAAPDEVVPPILNDEVVDEPGAAAEPEGEALPSDDNAPSTDYPGRPEWANDQTNIFRDGTRPEGEITGQETTAPEAQGSDSQTTQSAEDFLSEPAPIAEEVVADESVAPEPAQEPAVPESTDATGKQASWVIRNKETGEVIAETFDRNTVAALNESKYEAVPISEHLASINQQTAESTPQVQTEAAPVVATPEAVQPQELTPAEAVDVAASDTNIEPTEAQKEAGNYKKGRVKVQGLDIAIENPKGSTRSGTDPNGNRWESTMAHHYGYLNRTEGADGDHVDVFIGPDPESDRVFVVDQQNADGTFDEHKVLLGFKNQAEARKGYRDNYDRGWKVGPVKRLSMDEFKDWLKNGDTKKPLQPEKAKAIPATKAREKASAKVPDNAAVTQGAATEDRKALAEVWRQIGREYPDVDYGAVGNRNLGVMKRVKEATGREIYGPEMKAIFPQSDREAAFREGQGEGRASEKTENTGASSLSWKKDGKRLWRSDDGQIIADLSFTNGGIRTKLFAVFANDAARDKGDNYASGETLDEAKGKVMSQSKATPKPEDVVEPTAPIEDFGEKIEGARKDYASKMAAAKEKDVAAVPLSESWPEPDYQKLLDSGADARAVGMAHAARDAVPPKPRKGWKLSGWVRQVEALRNFTESVIDGEFTVDDLRDHARKDGYKTLEPHLFNLADLYAAVGHTKSLKGLRFSNAHFTIFDGKKGSFDKWLIERTAKTGSFGNMPRQLVAADTKEQAVEQFRELHKTLDARGAEPKNTRFDIYSSRYDRNDVFIGKKIGKDVVRIKEGFADAKEARAYLAENQDTLERILAKMKRIPNHRKESNSPRVGKDHRNGGDVTPEAFAEAFGFRGVQFGNYVEQGRRQQDLNEAYDGLMDLAGILNIPAKALSLNGELGLAFGARGKGGKNAPKAHYEPGNIVINLTKKSGAGSLAHEWWHSLDNYFARERGTSQHMGYATDGSAHMSVRPEVAEAFRNVKRTVNRVGLKQRSQKLDRVRTKAYWSTDVEMTARAFESYVIEKLQDQGASNDYLANIVSEDYWKASEALGMEDSDSYPYPEAAEIPEIRATYDNLFEVIEARDSGDGNVALFSREGYRRTPGFMGDTLTVEQAEQIRNELMEGWKGAPDVIIRNDIDQFPPGLQAAIRMAGAEHNMRGVFWNDTVYLLASRIPDRMRMEQVLLHEVVGHYGLRKMLGKDLEPVLNQIWAAHGGKTRADFIIRRYFPDGSFDANNKEHRHEIAEELIAHLAEQNRGQTLVQRAVAIIRNGLRKLGFKLKFTLDDIVNLIHGARRTVERGGFEQPSRFDIEPVQASRFDQPGNGNLPPGARFSRADVPDLDPEPFGAPSDTLLRKMISKLADKFTVLKGVQQNITDRFGEIQEDADAYLAEELFHGKVENDIRLIQENMIQPLAEKMSEYDVSLAQLDEFLYAKHAPERNRVIAQRNDQFPDGGSGMTNAEAAAVIDQVEKSGKLEQFQELADSVYQMLERRRKILKDAGLLDEETLGAWEASYRHYVPLKGWAADEKQEAMPKIGKGFAIAGKESQMAGGRKSKASSPVANAISDLSEAVLRQRKNEVGNAFLSLVQSYPNDGYWRVYTADNPEVERKAVKRVDPATGKTVVRVEEQTVPMAMMSDRYFTTKVNGETYYIKLQDQRLMNAMRNIGPENNGLLVRSLSMVTRLMSSLNTSYNPEFVISNFSRDIQTALLNLTSEQSADDGKARGKKIAAKTLKAVPVAIRAINASLKGKTLDGKAGEWQKHFDQFRADGAKTGWFDMKDVDGQMEDLETMISMASGGATNAARRAFRSVTDWVENTNSAIENGVRLSAYVNAIEAGIPRAKAASLAKNMTVNFNRKGELGTTMNALYMFANASVQGTANFVRTLGRLNGVNGDPVWRRLNTAQKIAAGMAVGGFMLSALNRLVAGDDDDGVNWWDKVPDYVKERNIVIMKSLVGGEPGEYWTIPLPYGYNIFPVIGTGMEHMLASDKPAGDIASNIVLAGLGSFSPIGFEQSEELYGLVAKNIMPTILRPVASISLNENFMGGPIFKENTPFGTPKPDSALYFRSTPEMFKALAKGLNEATGGSEFRSGAVDLSPDVMQFLIGYYGGGAYNFFTSRAPNAAVKWAQGVELEDREIPFYRKLHGKVLPYDDQSKFYDRRDEINQLVDERDNLRGRERVEFVKEYRDKLRLHGVIDSVEKRLKTLREQRDRVESMDLSAAETDKRLQHIEKQMKRVIDQFNKRYNESED